MSRLYTADLHVHTVLSPCAAVEMTPRHIVRQAVELGIDLLAITDHNACDNVATAMAVAQGTGLVIIPGMEVETKEEAHVLTLFETLPQLLEWEAYVATRRSGRKNDEQKFGAQFIVDAEDNLLAIKEDMLLGSINAELDEVVQTVAALGGITIASHVDRPIYSVLSQLGFIPADIELAAVEVSRLTPVDQAARLPGIGGFPVITSSDAHTMDDFFRGPRTLFLLERPSLSEIRLALAGSQNRRIHGTQFFSAL